MAIKELVEFIGNPNIADKIDSDMLKQLGVDVVDRFNQDDESMKDWKEAVEAGMDLVKQELHPKSTPWPGAANFKSPLMTDASIAFGNRAQLELLRTKNLVKADIIGEDKEGLKQERADRVTMAMNYQVNYRMPEWKKDQKRLLYSIPNVGAVFKKTIFDPLLGRNISHVIHYPDYAVNQASSDISTTRSFTHILDKSKNQIFELVQAKIWLDEDLYPEESDGDKGSNEEEEVTKARDNPNNFLEQYCFADLDDDGYEEPYIVTVHQQTKKVVRVVARFDISSIIVMGDDEVVKTLEEAQIEIDEAITKFAEPLNIEPQEPTDRFKGLSLVRIEAERVITQYGFLPSADGTFLDRGYFHILGAIVMGVNTTTNQLLDAGTLANRQSGLLAKGFRKKMGPISFKPGEFKSTELPAAQLSQGIMPLPIKEPSQTLFALNEKLEATGRQVAASVDASGQIQANTAPTTALAIIQEQLVPFSALMTNIIDSESEEFQRMFKLDQKFFDPKLYQTIMDDPNANFEEDFKAEGFDIVPTASAEHSSKMQRIQLAEVEMSMFDRVLQAQGNPIPIVKNFFDAIGSQITDQVFPDEAKMSPEDKAQLDGLRQLTEQQNQLLEQQNQIAQLQATLLERAEDRKDFTAQADVEESLAKLEEDSRQFDEKLEADELKSLHEVSLKLTELEAKMGQDLSAQNQENAQTLLTFDPFKGEFVSAS